MRKLFAVLPLFAIGCMAPNAVIVVRPDLQAGTFAVVPSDDSPREADFAGTVEKTLMSLGASLSEPPALKFLPKGSPKPYAPKIKEEANMHELVTDSRPTDEVQGARIVDAQALYDDAGTDYIALTYAGLPGAFRRVRIIRRKDKSLVASVDYPYDHDTEIGVANPGPLYSSLTAAGIIKTQGAPLSCGVVQPPKKKS